MDELVLDGIVSSVPDQVLLDYLEEIYNNSIIMNKAHNIMSRRYYMIFIGSSLSIQLISVGIGIATIAAGPLAIILIGTGINAIIAGSIFQTLDVSGKSKLHRVLAQKHNKIKQFISMANISNVRQVNGAVGVLKQEINSLNDIFIPRSIIKKLEAEHVYQKINRSLSSVESVEIVEILPCTSSRYQDNLNKINLDID